MHLQAVKHARHTRKRATEVALFLSFHFGFLALRDQAITDGTMNVNWNTVWDVKAVRSDVGYTIEMRIPFKSLRYRAAGPQIWGMNVRRVVKWKNEVSNLTQVPASYNQNGVSQMSVAGCPRPN